MAEHEIVVGSTTKRVILWQYSVDLGNSGLHVIGDIMLVVEQGNLRLLQRIGTDTL